MPAPPRWSAGLSPRPTRGTTAATLCRWPCWRAAQASPWLARRARSTRLHRGRHTPHLLPPQAPPALQASRGGRRRRRRLPLRRAAPRPLRQARWPRLATGRALVLRSWRLPPRAGALAALRPVCWLRGQRLLTMCCAPTAAATAARHCARRGRGRLDRACSGARRRCRPDGYCSRGLRSGRGLAVRSRGRGRHLLRVCRSCSCFALLAPRKDLVLVFSVVFLPSKAASAHELDIGRGTHAGRHSQN